jgi:tripartite-type tricarboxylate transporter receptor subunit TctC
MVVGIAPALAQGYPTRAVTIIVPLAAGTGMDTLARLYGDQLGQALGTAAVAAAPPDGHTIGISTAAPMSVAQVLYKKINYDPDKDFTPIYFYVKSPFVLIVNPALPINSVPELIKYAKESANPMTYSSPGAGVLQHLAIEFMAQRFGLKMTHVPYRNSPQSITDIAAATSILASRRPARRCRSFARARCARLRCRRRRGFRRCPTCRRSAKRRTLPTSKPCPGTCYLRLRRRRRKSWNACTRR